MEQNNIWYVVVTAIVSPIIAGLFGYWRLKRLGINKYNVSEVSDRAAFRASLLKRIEYLERQQEQMAARERELIKTCASQEREIVDLKRDHEEMKVQLATKDDEIRKLRKRVKGIEAGQPVED